MANWKLGYFGGATRPAKRHAWLSHYITVAPYETQPIFVPYPSSAQRRSVCLSYYFLGIFLVYLNSQRCYPNESSLQLAVVLFSLAETATPLLYRCRKDGACALFLRSFFFSSLTVGLCRSYHYLCRKVADSHIRRAQFHSSHLLQAETVKVPQMAESISEGTLRSWSKQVGDSVEADEEVATIETDKVGIGYFTRNFLLLCGVNLINLLY